MSVAISSVMNFCFRVWTKAFLLPGTVEPSLAFAGAWDERTALHRSMSSRPCDSACDRPVWLCGNDRVSLSRRAVPRDYGDPLAWSYVLGAGGGSREAEEREEREGGSESHAGSYAGTGAGGLRSRVR